MTDDAWVPVRYDVQGILAHDWLGQPESNWKRGIDEGMEWGIDEEVMGSFEELDAGAQWWLGDWGLAGNTNPI